MPAVGDILRRFRFHGVPGAPAPAGIPFDRSGAIEAELAPIFSSLEAAQDRSAALVEAASGDATRRRAEVAERVHRILAQARVDADATRADTAAVRLAHAARQRSALVAQAQEEAERIERVAAERTPGLVEELVARVLAMRELSHRTAPDPTATSWGPGPGGGPQR